MATAHTKLVDLFGKISLPNFFFIFNLLKGYISLDLLDSNLEKKNSAVQFF